MNFLVTITVAIIIMLLIITITRTIVLTEPFGFGAVRVYGAGPCDYLAVAGRCASSSHGQGGHEWVQTHEVRVRGDPHGRWDVSKVKPAGQQYSYWARRQISITIVKLSIHEP